MDINKVKIGIIGMGYVGAPLAVEFGKKLSVIGFDINLDRILDLSNGIDNTLELSSDEINESTYLNFTSNIEDLSECEIYIVTVPTPVDKDKKPNLTALIEASKLVGGLITKNNIVIYESTVFPGATEEVCVPEIEESSGLRFNEDFFCGYSPERVNPGDKLNRVNNIIKVTSGSTPDVAEVVDKLYKKIVTVGTHKATSIKVAEAAKVIENTQRDVNIALINEFALIFDKIGIDTQSVLDAARTKWNFLHFSPGLVGGHCIGVDPYYLTYKAMNLGYDPQMILAGRNLNDSMGQYIAEAVFKIMNQKKIKVVGSNVLIMGLTFKENCPDIRNTKVIDLERSLTRAGCSVEIFDPWVDSTESKKEYGIGVIKKPSKGKYDTIIIAVAHDQFKRIGYNEISSYAKENNVIYDIKSIFGADYSDGRL